MKKTAIILMVSFFSPVSLFSQDGSDILYLHIDSAHRYFDRKFHVDFNQRSRAGSNPDTVSIAFKDKSVRFVERRVDDGYNNWFNEQYLESLESIGGVRLRLLYSRFVSITRDDINVINYFNFFNDKGIPLYDKPIEDSNSYRKKRISQVLIYSP